MGFHRHQHEKPNATFHLVTCVCRDIQIRTAVCRGRSERGLLRLVFLRINEEVAGMQIAIECDDRFWLLKIAYDEKFATCSPGTLLMLHSVKHAAVRGLKSYEFLGTAERWTRPWTESLRRCVALRAYPLSIGGIAVMTCVAGADLIVSIRRSLSEWRALRP